MCVYLYHYIFWFVHKKNNNITYNLKLICGMIGNWFNFSFIGCLVNRAIKKSNCFHQHGDKSPCHMSSNLYMIMFGVIQIFLSQIPDFDQIWWLSSVAAFMSFTYSLIGLALGIAKVAGYIFGPFSYNFCLWIFHLLIETDNNMVDLWKENGTILGSPSRNWHWSSFRYSKDMEDFSSSW